MWSPETVMSAAFVLALLAGVVLKFWLASRQIRHVAAFRSQVPDRFTQTVTLQAHQKAADYTITKTRFGLLELALATAVLLGWTLLGGLDALNQALLDSVQPRFGDMAYQLALLAAFALIGGALDLPFELYSTFRIEQRFGFNRMTAKLFIADLLKNSAVGALIVGLEKYWTAFHVKRTAKSA